MTCQCKQTYNSSKQRSSQELGEEEYEYDIPVQTDIQQHRTVPFSRVG